MSTSSVNQTASGAAFLMEHTALGRRVSDLLSLAKENRRDTERRWNDIQSCLEARPGDSPGGKFKKSNASEDWRCKDHLPFARMKVRAARAVGENVVLKSDQVPVRARVPDGIREAVDAAAAEGGKSAAEIEAEARKELLALLRDTNAARELLALWSDGARLGESVSHVTEALDTRFAWELSGGSTDGASSGGFSRVERPVILPGCERVDPWECYRDMEHPRLDEGRYFFREQPADKSEVAALAASLPPALPSVDAGDDGADEVPDDGAAGSSGEEPRLPVFSRAAVVRALRLHAAASGDAPSESAGDDGESPGLRVPIKRGRTGRIVEGWVRVPRGEIDNFAEHWRRDAAVDGDAAAGIDHVSAHEPVRFACDVLSEADTDLIQVFVANGEIVGFNQDPGRLTYHREMWEDHDNGVDGFGVAEAAAPFQSAITGQVRSFMDNSKLMSNLILAVQRHAMKTRVEDVFREGGVLEIEADEDVRKAIQQVQFTDVTGSLLKGIEMFLHFGDLGTQMPREFHGQQPEYQSTATEVTARMDQAGKYVTGVARRFDGHVSFIAGHYESYLEGRFPVEFEGTGSANVQEMVTRFQRVMGMFQMILSSDRLVAWANLEWWLREVSELQDIPFAEAWRSADEVAADAQAERESEERQLALAEARAKAAKLEAEADRATADAEMKRGRLSMDRARVASGLQTRGQGRQVTGDTVGDIRVSRTAG